MRGVDLPLAVGRRICLGVALAALTQHAVLAADLAPPAAILPPVPAVGDTFQAVPAPLPSVSLVGSSGPFIGLSVQDAVGMALTHNPDLALSEANRRIARYQVVADRGPYDLTLNVAPQFSFTKIPAESPFQAGPNGGTTTQIESGITGGLSLLTPGGTTFSVSTMAERIATDSTASAYDPYFQTGVSFNVNTPLAGGRYSKKRRDLELAIVNQKTQSASTLIAVSGTITDVIDAYWDLVAAWRNLGIQEEALHQAQAQTSSNNRLVQRGSAAPVDVVESNTQVDVDQDNVFSALQNVATIENRLKSLVLGNPADPVWQANLVPTSPVAEIPPEPQLDAILIAGLVQRPEFMQIAAAAANARIALAYARDESRPQVDLQLGVTKSGFAGEPGNITQNPVFSGFTPLFSSVNSLIANANAGLPASAQLPTVPFFSFSNPANNTGRFGQSWATLLSNDYPTYTAQVNLSLPIKNDAGRGDYAIALEQERDVQIQEISTIQRLIVDARNALQAFDSARQRLISAHAARVAADRVLQGEIRRFANGRSTTFLVLERQINAANTQGRELQAQTDVNKAVAELDRVSGAVFIKHGIHFVLPSRDEVDHRLAEIGIGKPRVGGYPSVHASDMGRRHLEQRQFAPVSPPSPTASATPGNTETVPSTPGTVMATPTAPNAVPMSSTMQKK